MFFCNQYSVAAKCHNLFPLIAVKLLFGDFNKLGLEGSQVILTPGEYCLKENTTKANRQKVIKYFYDKIERK